jgi:hypothetical protein
MPAQANGLGRVAGRKSCPSPKVARLPPQSGNPMPAQANGLGRVDGRKSGQAPTGAIRMLVAGRSRYGPTGPRRDVVQRAEPRAAPLGLSARVMGVFGSQAVGLG